MNVRISFTQMRCLSVQHPRTDDDEIYFAYLVSQARQDGQTAKVKPITAVVSDVKKNVSKGTVWKPALEDIVLDDVEPTGAVILQIGVYEEDDGKLHGELVRGLDSLPQGTFDWKVITIPEDVANVGGWINVGVAVLKELVRYLKSDDRLKLISDDVDLQSTGWTGTREYEVKSGGADYRLTITVTQE